MKSDRRVTATLTLTLDSGNGVAVGGLSARGGGRCSAAIGVGSGSSSDGDGSSTIATPRNCRIAGRLNERGDVDVGLPAGDQVNFGRAQGDQIGHKQRSSLYRCNRREGIFPSMEGAWPGATPEKRTCQSVRQTKRR